MFILSLISLLIFIRKRIDYKIDNNIAIHNDFRV